MIKLGKPITASAEQMMFIIEGMRNPMNSWGKSDSQEYNKGVCFVLGNNDRALMTKLAKAGIDHRKFMRMMPVYVRIIAPLYWWKEFDTYKVGTVSNSCSTMHKIHAKDFNVDDFSHEHLTKAGLYCLNNVISDLNSARYHYIESKDKTYWYEMIQLLPSSYNQTRNVMLNYEVLANIYKSRKNHKLDEWREFCSWIENCIPYSELITGIVKEENNENQQHKEV